MKTFSTEGNEGNEGGRKWKLLALLDDIIEAGLEAMSDEVVAGDGTHAGQAHGRNTRCH